MAVQAKGLKPYPAYKDAGLPWLERVPSTWNVRRNGGLFAQRNETGFADLPILEVSLKTGVAVRDLSGNGSRLLLSDRDKYKRARKNDLAYNMMRLWQGAIGVAPIDGLVSPAYVVARPLLHVEPRYFERLFRIGAYMGEVDKFSHGIAKDRNRLYWEEFKQMPSPVPPPAEQSAIARFLDHYDRRIRRYILAKQRLSNLLSEERETITQDAMRSSGTRSLRLGAIADSVHRPVHRQADQIYTSIGLLNRGRGIFHKKPAAGDELGDSTFFWVEARDLVLSGQFAWEGAVALAGHGDAGCIASHRYPIFRGQPGVAEPAYLLAFLKTDIGKLLLDQHSRGAAGRNRPLNVRTLMKEKVPTPPLPIQRRVCAIVDREARLSRAVASTTTMLREYRARMIADIVTGKLDVREAAAQLQDEVEETEPEGAWVLDEMTDDEAEDAGSELEVAEP